MVVTAAVTLVRALGAGGRVIWEPADRPKLRLPQGWGARVDQDIAGARAVMERAVVFHRQLDVTHRSPVIPFLTLPGIEAKPGQCISCGEELARAGNWRCIPCLTAVLIAIDDMAGLARLADAEDAT